MKALVAGLMLVLTAPLCAQCTRWVYSPFTRQQDCASTATGGSGVGGGASLTTANIIPKVSSAGVLGNSGLKNPSGGILAPVASDSTTAIQFNKNDGTTPVVTVDTTNGALGINSSANTYGLTVTNAATPVFELNTLSVNSAARNWGFATNYTTFGDFQFRVSSTRGGSPFSGGTARFLIDGNGNMGLGTGTSAVLGKLQTVISATSPVIFGGATVASYTTVTSPTANKDYLNKTGIGTANAVGNLAIVTAGTGVYTGMYRIITIVSADSVQVDRAVHASGTDVTDVSVSTSTAYNQAVGVSRQFNAASLTAATGNEVAFRYDYTTNKATSGNDTGLQINMTDTASPGTSYPLEINVGGSRKLSVDQNGIVRPVQVLGTSVLFDPGGYSRTGLSLGSATMLYWEPTNSVLANAPDLALSRTSAGLLQVNSGTAGKWAGLDTGLINMKSLATPTGLTVAPQGTTGATTYGYKVAALLADGTTTTAATSEVTIANGNATLTATEYNKIDWTAVTGATCYNVFRTTGGATQGKITATCQTAITLNDTGIAASGSAPSTNGTGSLLWATDGGGSIGASGANRPLAIYTSSSVNAGSSVYVASTGGLYITSRLFIGSSANGVMELYNSGTTGFTRLNFGGSTYPFPALAVSTGTLQARDATGNGWAGLAAGSISMTSLATPTGLTVVPQGTTGATTYGYKVAALLADGTTTTAATAEVTIANGNATLTATEFNRVSWTAVTGASCYNVFRITGGATQGKITAACQSAVTIDDTGIAASGSAPSTNGTGSLLWATDGVGTIGTSSGGRPLSIDSAGLIRTATSFSAAAGGNLYFGAWGYLTATADGVQKMSNNAGTGFTRLNFGGTTNSFSGIATSSINGFAIQSAAGTSTFNDAVTAGSGAVAARRIFDIDTPTLTATNASVTYTTATALHLGVPTASTNVTIGAAFSLIADGVIKAGGYQSSDGTAGVTVTTCTGFKDGLCISGT